MDQESITLEVDPRSVLAAIKQANTAVDGWENKTVGAGDRMQKSLERMADMLLKMNDRSRSSMERLTQSIEKQAAAYGKTGVDRLIADRDRIIKRLGDEQGMIDRVTAAYAKMIDVENGKSGGSFQAMGRNIESFIRDPLNGAKEAASGLTESMGTVGMAAGLGATAVAALAAAGWEAAKSLGEYGVQIKDVELRTGMTAKEVGQFAFAAKAAGQDVTVLDRMVRGLTQAVEDDSKASEKARGWLEEFGVDIAGMKAGTADTAEVLQQIASGLDALPSTWDRNKAAMDLFKRAGIEAIPVMLELTQHLKTAREEGFGPTDADIARFTAYQEKVAALETKWAALKRTFQEGLVITISFAGNAAKWLLEHMPGETVSAEPGWEQRVQAADLLANDIRNANTAKWGPYPPANPIDALQRKRMEALRGLRPEDAYAPAPGQDDYRRPDVLKKLGEAAGYKMQIGLLQKDMARAAEAERAKAVESAGQEADRLRARYFGGHDALEKAYNDAKKDVEKYQQDLAAARGNKATLDDVRSTGAKLAEAVRKEAQAKAALDTEQKRKKFDEEAAAFAKKGAEAELDAIGKIYFERDQLLKQAKDLGAAEASLASIRTAADEKAAGEMKKLQAETDKARGAMEREEAKRTEKATRERIALLYLPSKEELKQWEDVDRARERIQDIGVQSQRDQLRRHASLAGKTAATPEDAYKTRVDLAIQLGDIEAARIAKETDAAKRMIEAAEAQKDLQTELAAAQDELAEKRAEAERKATEELQRQVDEISKTTTGLFRTLLTKPSEFGHQLVGTIRESIVGRAANGLGNMAANAIHPLIFGTSGQGGIAGVFRGIFGDGNAKDPIKVSTDLNTAVTAQNSAAIAALTAVFAAAMGAGVPAIAAPGGMPGGFSIPAITAPAPAISWSVPAGPGLAAPSGGGLLSGDYAAGTASTSPIGGVFGGAGGGARSGGFNIGGFAGLLKNFKGADWGGFSRARVSGVGAGPDGSDVDDSNSGRITGVHGMAGAALSMGGMMLASQGLLGANRGTWGGIAEGAAGGAMIGMAYGGPLGALIGGVAGFGIGLGEKLAGIESPENRAKRLIKQLYGVSIDNNMAKQVAGIAQQSFGGNVDMAVRSDQVRQLVKLYAEALGQKTNLTALAPHAASLIQANGKLYQGAVYDNGQAYTYGSGLPTYGGVQSATLPTASPYAGNVNVSLNPQQTVDLWKTGTTQAVAGNPRLVSASAAAGDQMSASRVSSAISVLAPGVIEA